MRNRIKIKEVININDFLTEQERRKKVYTSAIRGIMKENEVDYQEAKISLSNNLKWKCIKHSINNLNA